MKLNNCKFIAIDEVDDIFEQARDDLAKILEIGNAEDCPSHVITCSATMKGHFMKFYKDVCPNHIALNATDIVEKEVGKKVTLEGVSNYHKVFSEGKAAIHKFILNEIFKELYSNPDKKKPQAFIFFNSVDEIKEFDDYFQTVASDFTTDQSEYLGAIKRDTIAARVYKDNKKVELSVKEKDEIMEKFRNN